MPLYTIAQPGFLCVDVAVDTCTVVVVVPVDTVVLMSPVGLDQGPACGWVCATTPCHTHGCHTHPLALAASSCYMVEVVGEWAAAVPQGALLVSR